MDQRFHAVAWDGPPPMPVRITGVVPGRDAEAVTSAVDGPESILIEPATRAILTGDEHGRVWRFDAAGGRAVRTGGRPLGLAFDRQARVLVANHPLGLQRIEHDGKVTTLAREAAGRRIEFANAVAVDAQGRAYFTDSNDAFNLAHGYAPPFGALDMLEARPRGRLVRHDPADGSTVVVCDGLHFPNGLAFARDEQTLYLAETFRCRVRAVNAATSESHVFVEGLPGYPDNLAVDPITGLLWIAMGVRRTALHDWVQRQPRLKRFIAGLPRAWWQRPTPRALLLAVAPDGEVRHALSDPRGSLGLVSHAVPHEGWLYIGTLSPGRAIIRIPLPV